MQKSKRIVLDGLKLKISIVLFSKRETSITYAWSIREMESSTWMSRLKPSFRERFSVGATSSLLQLLSECSLSIYIFNSSPWWPKLSINSLLRGRTWISKLPYKALKKPLTWCANKPTAARGYFYRALSLWECLITPEGWLRKLFKLISLQHSRKFIALKFYRCGMLITSINVISVFTDPTQIATMKPQGKR